MLKSIKGTLKIPKVKIERAKIKIAKQEPW